MADTKACFHYGETLVVSKDCWNNKKKVRAGANSLDTIFKHVKRRGYISLGPQAFEGFSFICPAVRLHPQLRCKDGLWMDNGRYPCPWLVWENNWQYRHILEVWERVLQPLKLKICMEWWLHCELHSGKQRKKKYNNIICNNNNKSDTNKE